MAAKETIFAEAWERVNLKKNMKKIKKIKYLNMKRKALAPKQHMLNSFYNRRSTADVLKSSYRLLGKLPGGYEKNHIVCD